MLAMDSNIIRGVEPPETANVAWPFRAMDSLRRFKISRPQASAVSRGVSNTWRTFITTQALAQILDRVQRQKALRAASPTLVMVKTQIVPLSHPLSYPHILFRRE